MKTLQITYLSEYHDSMVEDIETLGLTVLTYGSTNDTCSLILEGPDEAVDLMEDFMNGEAFI